MEAIAACATRKVMECVMSAEYFPGAGGITIFLDVTEKIVCLDKNRVRVVSFWSDRFVRK